MTSLKVSSSYRSFTALSMATLPPSRSSCMAAMCFLKSIPLTVDLVLLFLDLGLLVRDLGLHHTDLLFLLANAVLHRGDLTTQHTDLDPAEQ